MACLQATCRRPLRWLFDKSVEGHLGPRRNAQGTFINFAPPPHSATSANCMRPHLGEVSGTNARQRWRSWPLPPPIGIEASQARNDVAETPTTVVVCAKQVARKILVAKVQRRLAAGSTSAPRQSSADDRQF